MSAVWSSFKRTANNPRRFDKPWQLTDMIWKHCKNQARRLVSKICVEFDASKEKSSCAQPLECPFELGFTEQIPKILEDNSKPFRAFWEHFSEANEPKKPQNIFQTEKFRTIFEKGTPIYSLAAPLLGMAKSTYYAYVAVSIDRSVY